MYRHAGRANVPLVAVVAVSCLVAGLALAALDDITTGVEPDFALEWAFVSLAAAWFVGGGRSMWKRTSRPGASTGMQRRSKDARR